MSSPDTPNNRRIPSEGGATAGRGTPVAVDVAIKRRTTTTILVFLAGPVIWSLHFMLVYLVVEAGCTGDGPGLRLFDPPVPTVVTLATTAVAALACLATMLWGYRRWRADRTAHADGQGIEPPDPGGSLAFAGFLLSLLGFISVLLVGLPAAVLPACTP